MPINNRKFASDQEERVCKTLLDKFFAYYKKTVLVVYERTTENLVLRTLVHVDTPANEGIIADGKEIHDLFDKDKKN